MGLTELLIEKITAFMNATGYPSVAILMMLESMIAPVPSEAVMPFAGWLIAQGRFSWTGVAVSSTIGSIVGSWISYAMGYYGGKPFVTRFGRFFLLNMHDLEVTERFFNKYGSITIFIGRFIPVIRHLISIPAGAGRMNLVHFSVYTTVGACIWNMFLTWCGFLMKENWTKISKYTHTIDIVMVALILAAIAYFIKSHIKQAIRSKDQANG